MDVCGSCEFLEGGCFDIFFKYSVTKQLIENEWNNSFKKWKHIVSPGRAGAREDF